MKSWEWRIQICFRKRRKEKKRTNASPSTTGSPPLAPAIYLVMWFLQGVIHQFHAPESRLLQINGHSCIVGRSQLLLALLNTFCAYIFESRSCMLRRHKFLTQVLRITWSSSGCSQYVINTRAVTDKFPPPFIEDENDWYNESRDCIYIVSIGFWKYWLRGFLLKNGVGLADRVWFFPEIPSEEKLYFLDSMGRA